MHLQADSQAGASPRVMYFSDRLRPALAPGCWVGFGWLDFVCVSRTPARAASAGHSASWKSAANSAPTAAGFAAHDGPTCPGCRRSETANASVVRRSVRPAAPAASAPSARCKTFDRLQGVPCLAMLGEPGIGKSWTLSREALSDEATAHGAKLLRFDLRQFGSEGRLFNALFESEELRDWKDG